MVATPGQTGMIFHALAEPESAVYAIHTTLRLAPGVDVDALQTALDGLVARHGALRTRFDWMLAGRPLQVVLRQAWLPLALVDGRGAAPEAHAARVEAFLAAECARPIPLDAAPAMRATLLIAPDGSADLALAIHHAVVDGWSLPLLLADLIALYDRADRRPGRRTPAGAGLRGSRRLARPAGSRGRARPLAGRRRRRRDRDRSRDRPAGARPRPASSTAAAWRSPPRLLAPAAERARAAGVTVATLVEGAFAALLARLNQGEGADLRRHGLRAGPPICPASRRPSGPS